MDLTQPCKNCKPPKRHQGCHSTCPEGLAADKKHKEEKAKLDAIKIREAAYNGYKAESRERMRKWSVKKHV